MSKINIVVAAQTGSAVKALDDVTKATQRTGSGIRNAQKKVNQFGGSLESARVSTRKFAMGGLQQAGYQIGDYAVQVANGTSKMQAFGQQAPQLLQIFGPIGAVVGAGVAIFAAFKVAVDKSAQAAKEAAGDMGTFSASMAKAKTTTSDAAAAISAAASSNVENARKKFSDFDGDLKGYLETMARVRKDQALTAVSLAANKFFEEQDALSDLRGEYGSFVKDRSSYARAVKDSQSDRVGIIKEYQLEISALKSLAEAQEATGVIGAAFVTKQQIQELSSELRAIQTNSIEPFMSSLSLPEDTIQNLLIFENAIKSAFDSGNIDGAVKVLGQMRTTVDALPDPIKEQLLPALLEMEGFARRAGVELSDGLNDASDASDGLVVKLSAATKEAKKLSEALANAPSGVQAMKNQTEVIRAELSAINSGYGEIAASAAAFRKQREQELGLADAGHEMEEAYINAQINRDVAAFEARAKANAELAKARGIFDSASEGGSKLSQTIKREISPEMQRLKDIQDSVGQSFENAMMSAVDGTKSVKGAFKSMASEVIKELYRIFVVKKITGFISDMIGGFGGSAPTTSLRPVARPASFSGGGYTGSGARAGGMDGKGGFMAMVHPRETIVDHTKGQGAGGVTVNQTINVSTGVQQTVRTEIKTLMPQIAEAAKSAVADAKLRGGSYGRSFA